MESHLFYKREKYQFLFDILPISNEQMRETVRTRFSFQTPAPPPISDTIYQKL